MDANPASIQLLGQRDGGSAGPVKSSTVAVETRTGPGRDHDGHSPVRASEHRGVAEIEGKVLSTRPDIVPLGVSPGHEPTHQFLMCAEDDNVRMPERPGRGVIDVTDAGGKAREPIMDRRRGTDIGDWQGERCTVHRRYFL